MRLAHRFDLVLFAVVAALLVVALNALAAVSIVGIDCKRLVLIGADTVVCVTPVEQAIPGLLKVVDTEDFVRESYEVLLLRAPDAPGQLYWTAALTEGRTSREGMLNAIVGSTEFRALKRY